MNMVWMCVLLLVCAHTCVCLRVQAYVRDFEYVHMRIARVCTRIRKTLCYLYHVSDRKCEYNTKLEMFEIILSENR